MLSDRTDRLRCTRLLSMKATTNPWAPAPVAPANAQAIRRGWPGAASRIMGLWRFERAKPTRGTLVEV